MYAVEANHLAKRFGQTQAVADVSFAVSPGEIFGLLGPNGSGKTTSIRMLLDIFKPDSGMVQVFGGDLDMEKKRPHRLHARGARAVQGPETGADPGLPGGAEGPERAGRPRAPDRLAGAL